MKKSYIGIVFVVFIFGVFVIRNINHHKDPRNISYGTQTIDNVSNTLEYLVLNGEKSKVADFTFIDQNNLPISLADYQGKVWVMDFFFASCPTICPIMTQSMTQIEKAYGQNENFGMASITINPANDTPIALKKYADKYEVSSLNWHFLTGERDKIYDLANQMNVYAKVNSEAPGGFEHSGQFALVDKQGYIRCRRDVHGNPIAYYDGLSQLGVKQIKEDIKKLLEE